MKPILLLLAFLLTGCMAIPEGTTLGCARYDTLLVDVTVAFANTEKGGVKQGKINGPDCSINFGGAP